MVAFVCCALVPGTLATQFLHPEEWELFAHSTYYFFTIGNHTNGISGGYDSRGKPVCDISYTSN